MADDYIGIRIPPDLRAALIATAEPLGMTLSDYIRTILHAAVSGQVDPQGGAIAGFIQARSLAVQLAANLLRDAAAGLPTSYEEAVARGLVAGPEQVF